MLLRSRHKPLCQSGLNMIRVLVTLLLISIGVLDMITMQDKITRRTIDSVRRNKVAILGSNLLESMRTSPKALYDAKGQTATQSDFLKAKGSTFPTAPSSCTSLPDATKDRLECWTERAKNELSGVGDLLKSDYYIYRSSKPGDYDGEGFMLETRLAWRGEQGACINVVDNSANISLCYCTLRVEP